MRGPALSQQYEKWGCTLEETEEMKEAGKRESAPSGEREPATPVPVHLVWHMTLAY